MLTSEVNTTEARREDVTAGLTWHKPTIQRLGVSLDTRDAGGSQGDGEFGTLFDFAEV